MTDFFNRIEFCHRQRLLTAIFIGKPSHSYCYWWCCFLNTRFTYGCNTYIYNKLVLNSFGGANNNFNYLDQERDPRTHPGPRSPVFPGFSKLTKLFGKKWYTDLWNRQKYVRTSREVQRIEGILRSPVNTCYTETITGRSTIDAYKIQVKFLEAKIRLISLSCRSRVDESF